MYNYYIEMDLKNYTTIITNLSIIITFLYSIILIIDELYNIGFFSFKYTYLYNYGSFMSDFNNIQSIECETNRFNVYANNNFIYKDIFSKSYFNYLIIIAITFITILFVIAYGINFYFTFIINQPEVCSFYKSTSFIKTIMKCLCDSCHEFIPDCTGNYFITFIILIIIPISYLLKSFLNIDITPNSTSMLFSLGYIILFILLLFTYSYILFNMNKTANNTTERLKEIGFYIFFTIIFIFSGYIYKYIYNKYNDITLNRNNNPETLFDIYKQAPPTKPKSIPEPIFKGKNLLDSFKYEPKNTNIEYKQKKEIMDEYYISVRNYDKDMLYYTQRYNNYINSNAKLSDTTNIINIIINILGLNNKIHLYIIGLLVFASGIYYFYNNDLLFICVIYLICIITILTIINAILYYNTIHNKYIIYEPMAYYKNDITNANTKLNLLLDPSNGDGFYNILTNNKNQSNKGDTIGDTPETIIKDIKSLIIFDNFTTSKLSTINSNCSNLIIPITDNIIDPNTYTIYYSSTGNNTDVTSSNIKTHIFDKITSFSPINNNINIFNYNYNPITFIDIYYDDTSKIRLTNLHYYNRYVYYYSYLFENLIIKLKSLYTPSVKKLDKYEKIFNKIQINYYNYQLNSTSDATLKSEIKTDINSITAIDSANRLDSSLNDNFYNIIDKFIKQNIITVNKYELSSIGSKTFSLLPSANNFIYKLNINPNKNLTLTYIDDKYRINNLLDALLTNNDVLYSVNINNINNIDETTNKDIIDIKYITKDKIFNYISTLYVIVPTKIKDNYNELYIKFSVPLTKITVKEGSYNKIAAYPKNNMSDVSNDYKFTLSSGKDYTTSSGNSTFKAPYILKEDNTESQNTNLGYFKQIILSSLLYNLIHITSKYEYKPLKEKLYYRATNPDTSIKNIDRVDYNTFFTTISIAPAIPMSPHNFLSNNGGYAVLLYNVYTYDKDRIINIIEYFIYNISTYNTDKYTTDPYLSSKILSIKTQIDKTGDKTDLMKLYENSRYIINLILKLYDNLIKFIKKEIETNIDASLCHSTSATNTDIEKQLMDHFNKYLTITQVAAAPPTIVNSAQLTAKNEKITKIGMAITHFFNICIFLLNNVESQDKIQDENKESIVSNFKFYNTDDTISLDSSNMENIRKTLTINCDYYSKYNNMDKKQKLYMKINADNVAYSFPILIVIFAVILGETAFIKS
jgi:hypothetical protein